MGDQKLSRRRLSEATGISRPSLANKLDGKVALTCAELMSIIEVLGVAWEELLADDDRPHRLRDFHARPDRPL